MQQIDTILLGIVYTSVACVHILLIWSKRPCVLLSSLYFSLHHRQSRSFSLKLLNHMKFKFLRMFLGEPHYNLLCWVRSEFNMTTRTTKRTYIVKKKYYSVIGNLIWYMYVTVWMFLGWSFTKMYIQTLHEWIIIIGLPLTKCLFLYESESKMVIFYMTSVFILIKVKDLPPLKEKF